MPPKVHNPKGSNCPRRSLCSHPRGCFFWPSCPETRLQPPSSLLQKGTPTVKPPASTSLPGWTSEPPPSQGKEGGKNE